jgi:hypothetical protein
LADNNIQYVPLNMECQMYSNNYDERSNESGYVARAVVMTVLTVTALSVATASYIFLRHRKVRREANGHLVKVNYKFSKEFD